MAMKVMMRLVVTVASFAVMAQSFPAHMLNEEWGEKFCKVGFCGIMAPDIWETCCDHFNECCAYVRYSKPESPFAYEKNPRLTDGTGGDNNLFSNLGRNSEDTEEIPRLEAAENLVLANEDSPSSLPLREAPGSLVQPPHKETVPETVSETVPETIPDPNIPYRHVSIFTEEERREYNEREDCRAKFCAIMREAQWQRCCAKYDNCCAYLETRRHYDPFAFNG